MITPSAEQVRTLAPDAAAARAGEGLADLRRWSGIGHSETAAWGLCQGSGSSPYQAAVDLGGPAYKCSCPSRKIPCKHALGLMFLLAAGKIGEGQPPDWAATWLESRATRATRAATAATRPERPAEADPAARARRQEARERKVAAGIEELDRWLGDLMRRGLDSTRSEGYRFWDAMGARMVDAQAGGLGRSVRALGWASTAGESWPHLLLEGSSRLHLLCAAYRRADELPGPLRADVRSLVGWTTKEEDLDASDEVEDRWLVVGRRVDDTGQVITARTFLVGEVSGRFALHLAFGVDAAPPTALAMPGQAFRARLAFYPSAAPLRATVRPMLVPDGEVTSVPAAQAVREVVDGHAQRLALNPFLDTWPVVLRDVTPVMRGGRLIARDESGVAVPLYPEYVGSRLLAITGGRAATVVGEWDGSALRPMSVLQGERLVPVESDGSRVDGGRPEIGRSRDGDLEWSALLSAALLGTERIGATVPLPDAAAALVAEHDAEHSILAAAGVLAVRRRAGRRPGSDPEPPPDPAPDDPRPPLAGEAARLFVQVVTDDQSLLPEVLALVRASSRRVPDETLPDLLALAASDPDLGSWLADIGGPRAAWLAQMVPELAEGAVPSLGSDWNEAWDAARGARQKSVLMRAMRRADRTRARDSLVGWLPDIAGDERAAVLEALDEGLGPDDEPILAVALADRRADARRAAADLLVRLDGSVLNLLVESRARPLLATKGRLRASLAVTLPALDGELEAAGFGGRPGAGLGERAWLLRQLVAHVRPARWTEWLATDPQALVDLALGSDERRPLLEGWIEAATRFADPAWVRALVGEPRVAAAAQLDPARAIDALPAEQRADVAAAAAKSAEPATLARICRATPPPWPPPLADAVLATARKLGKAQYPDQAFYDLVRAAALGLPPDRADDLQALAAPDGLVRPALAGAIETVRLRARIHQAFATLPPADQPEVAR